MRGGRGAGQVTLERYKGNVIVIGHSSPKSLYSSTLVTFEDDKLHRLCGLISCGECHIYRLASPRRRSGPRSIIEMSMRLVWVPAVVLKARLRRDAGMTSID